MRKLKKYKRYVASFIKEKTMSNIFNNPVLMIDKKKPKTPYYSIEIRIIDFEPNYDHDRPTPGFYIRFCRAIKAAKKTFKTVLERG